mgnify:CR=1 FL=1
MIGRLRGILVEKQPPRLLVEVQGVGYELEASMSTFSELPAPGSEVILRTHLAVKEDGHSLYGFATERERSLFRNLIRVSGIGPKLALAVLSGMQPDDLVRCVESEDSAALTRLPGVGRKTAERLIIELRDRLAEAGIAGAAPGGAGPAGDAMADAASALVALGYKPADAQRLLRGIDGSGLDSEALIRAALQRAVR